MRALVKSQVSNTAQFKYESVILTSLKSARLNVDLVASELVQTDRLKSTSLNSLLVDTPRPKRARILGSATRHNLAGFLQLN
jgi:hypothetical protein